MNFKFMKIHHPNIMAKYLNEMHHKQFEDQFEICLYVHLLEKLDKKGADDFGSLTHLLNNFAYY